MSYSGQYLKLIGFDNKAIYSYPVVVFDNDGDLIGYADSKSEVVTLWNSSSVNQLKGNISSTDDDFVFLFQSPSNKVVFLIRAVEFSEIDANITLIGTSYFSPWAQTQPYLYEKIATYFDRTLTGYNTNLDNNGKVSHDRLRRVHELINGIEYDEALFFYWCVNDILYQDISGATDKLNKAIFKVKSSHYTALANCFSKAFNCFVDETEKTNTTNFTDTGNGFASKCGFLSKNILVLPDDTATVEFVSEGKTNIVYFVSDGVGQVLGTMLIYVNDELYETIECNDKIVDLTGLNDTIPTEGDNYCSPNSIVLNLPNGPHRIRIENSDASNPVWLDYWSKIETDVTKGAKPVIACNIPSFEDGVTISARWQIFNADVEQCNEAMQEVYDFWRNDLGAPVGLGDSYTGFDPNTMYSADDLHVNQAGSDHQLAAFTTAAKNVFRNKLLV